MANIAPTLPIIKSPERLKRVLEMFAYNIWNKTRNGKNTDDGGPIDWGTDTLPILDELWKGCVENKPAIPSDTAMRDEQAEQIIAELKKQIAELSILIDNKAASKS